MAAKEQTGGWGGGMQMR